MKALVDVCQQMAQHRVLPDDQFSSMLMDCVTKSLKQAAERIARIRETATSCTLRMLACQVCVLVSVPVDRSSPCLHGSLRAVDQQPARCHKSTHIITQSCMWMQETLQTAGRIRASEHIQLVLQTIVDKGAAGRVRSLPHIISLMSVRELRQSILEGAIASIGGVDQTLSTATANALVAMVLTPDMSVGTSGAEQCEGAKIRLCLVCVSTVCSEMRS